MNPYEQVVADIKVDFGALSHYKELLRFIRGFPVLGRISFWQLPGTVARKVDWTEVSYERGLTPYFFTLFRDYVDWNVLILRTDLPLDFYAAHEDRVDWSRFVVRDRLLTEEFIIRYQNVLNWNSISLYHDMSDECIERFVHKISPYFLDSNLKVRARGYDMNRLYERGDYGMWVRKAVGAVM